MAGKTLQNVYWLIHCYVKQVNEFQRESVYVDLISCFTAFSVYTLNYRLFVFYVIDAFGVGIKVSVSQRKWYHNIVLE